MNERPSINPNKTEAQIGEQIVRITKKLHERAVNVTGAQPDLEAAAEPNVVSAEKGLGAIIKRDFGGDVAATTMSSKRRIQYASNQKPHDVYETTTAGVGGLSTGSAEVESAKSTSDGNGEITRVHYSTASEKIRVSKQPIDSFSEVEPRSVELVGDARQAVINQVPDQLMSIRNEIAAREVTAKQQEQIRQNPAA